MKTNRVWRDRMWTRAGIGENKYGMRKRNMKLWKVIELLDERDGFYQRKKHFEYGKRTERKVKKATPANFHGEKFFQYWGNHV